MDVLKSVFLLTVFCLMSCGSDALKSSPENEQIVTIWSDWVIFPIKKVRSNTALVRNDYLMYRMKFEGYSKNYSAYKYNVQFKNLRDDLVKLKYALFSKSEMCKDLGLMISPNKESAIVAHLFEEKSRMFLELKQYYKVVNTERLIGKVD